MNLKSLKHLIQVILEAKVILKKMVHKIIQYFSQCTDILKGLVVLVVVIIFIFGNLKDCLMKLFNQLLLHVIIRNPQLSHSGTKARAESSASCLKQDKITYDHGKTVNIYTVYQVSKNVNISDYPTLEKFLFGANSLTKNTDICKYKYSGYGNGFDRHGFFTP